MPQEILQDEKFKSVECFSRIKMNNMSYAIGVNIRDNMQISEWTEWTK